MWAQMPPTKWYNVTDLVGKNGNSLIHLFRIFLSFRIGASAPYAFGNFGTSEIFRFFRIFRFFLFTSKRRFCRRLGCIELHHFIPLFCSAFRHSASKSTSGGGHNRCPSHAKASSAVQPSAAATKSIGLKP